MFEVVGFSIIHVRITFTVFIENEKLEMMNFRIKKIMALTVILSS